MLEADEFAELFETQQIGRLYLVSFRHRPLTEFNIFVLPEGEEAIIINSRSAPLNENAVEVYGIKNGNPGCPESYGWLHEGPWKRDFYKMVEDRKAEVNRNREADEITLRDKAMLEEERAKKLLSSYT